MHESKGENRNGSEGEGGHISHRRDTVGWQGQGRGDIQAPSRKVSCVSHYGTAESTAQSQEVLDVIQ